MKLKFSKIKEFLLRLLGKSKITVARDLRIKTVTVIDIYYDFMTDNDDIEDTPTLIDITYSESLGTILRKKLSNKRKGSCLIDVQNFYRSCSIDEWGGLKEYKKFSIYKENDI